MPSDILVIFSRYPRPGTSKTRLAPALGFEGAARLQRVMTGRSLLIARQTARSTGVTLEVRYAGGSARCMRRWLGPGPRYITQGRGDLGDRMARVFDERLDGGGNRVIIIGTDCPAVTPVLLANAYERLAQKDVVVGPAGDGGYYLIGLRKPATDLFEGITWGTGEVLEKTLAKIRRSGLSAAELPFLDDVDRPEDLGIWERESGLPSRQSGASRISVVIPSLNESEHIAACISAASPGAHEIIVVDGGSADTTAEEARARGATVIVGGPGRAAQMNAGALAASGDILVFLHADARLPRGYAQSVRRTLARPGMTAGAFRLGIDPGPRRLAMVEWGANWRARHRGLPYGDQALFMRRDVFLSLGGYADLPIMEDFDLVQRLRRGGRIGIAPPPPISVSARRWLRLGIGRTTLINQLVILGYKLGIPPSRLAAFYRRDASASSA